MVAKGNVIPGLGPFAVVVPETAALAGGLLPGSGVDAVVADDPSAQTAAEDPAQSVFVASETREIQDLLARKLPPLFLAHINGMPIDERKKYCDFLDSGRPQALLISTHGYMGPTYSAGDDSGGQIDYVNEMAAQLVAKGHKVTVVTKAFKPSPEKLQHGDRKGIVFHPENPLIRYVYVPGLLDHFVRKEEIYSELSVIATNLAKLLESEAEYVGKKPWELIEWVNSHYIDGGVVTQYLVRIWQNMFARRFLFKNFSRVLPKNFDDNGGGILRNLPYNLGMAVIAAWKKQYEGRTEISIDAIIMWLAENLGWDRAKIDEAKGILGEKQVPYYTDVTQDHALSIGQILLAMVDNVESLTKGLDRLNPHVHTPHSRGIVKEAGMLAETEGEPRYGDRNYYEMHFPTRRTFEDGILGFEDYAAVLGGLAFMGLPPAVAFVPTSHEISDALYRSGATQTTPQIYFPPGVDLQVFYPRTSVGEEDVRRLFEYLGSKGLVKSLLLRDMLEHPNKYNVLVEAGRMDITKRKHIIVEAMRLLPKNTVLFITGDRDTKGVHEELRTKIVDHELGDRVFLIGSLPSEHVGTLLGLPQGSDDDRFKSVIGVSASRMEGWGMAVQQMSAGGMPLVTSNLVPFTAALNRKKPGSVLIVPMGRNESERYASAIRTLIDDPKRGMEMADRGLQFVGDFSWSALTDNFLRRWEEILKEARKDIKARTDLYQKMDLKSPLVRIDRVVEPPYAGEFFIVILAGGKGKRLVPYSTPEMPKQFLKLTNRERTMLQLTADRALNLSTQDGRFPIPPERLFVVTSKEHAQIVGAQLPQVPGRNIIGEPLMKNTGPAIATVAYKIAMTNPKAPIVVVPADHFIEGALNLMGHLSHAVDVAHKRSVIVTFGIQPDWPSPEYGYLHAGEVLADDPDVQILRRFVEKPDVEVARTYLEDGGYLWNSGMFAATAQTFLDAFQSYKPVWHAGLSVAYAKERSGEPLSDAGMRIFYSDIQPDSVDYAIMEPAAADSKVVVMPMRNIGWSDLGTWPAIRRLVDRGNINPPTEIVEILKKVLDG